LAETRVIFYWRDLLQAAGVDEKTAFGTHKKLEQTLERLQKNGVSCPCVIPTAKTMNTLHNIRSWIGEAAGDFVDSENRRVTFADRAARSGMKDYYGLYRFISPEFYGLMPPQVDTLFVDKKAAVTINGPWVIFNPGAQLRSKDINNVGVAPLPGVSPVLASDLVIWKHTPVRYERPAVELVKFLTSHKAQLECSQYSGLLPARLETLESKPFSADPMYQVFVNGLKSGRSLPTMRLWGLVEERLTAAFASIWSRILAEPDPNLDAIIKAEMDPLAQRLNHILE
jgi:arabinogalactan oligomer/maltooligosaccharide transport system substrate-binding protein